MAERAKRGKMKDKAKEKQSKSKEEKDDESFGVRSKIMKCQYW